MPLVHSTAVVADQARLADDVHVGPYAVIGPRVTMGAGCRVEAHGVITGCTQMGEHNRIHSHAVIGSDPQDRKFGGERATCEIGDRNKIREQVTIHRGTGNGGDVTRIGNDNLIMVAAHIAHDCWIEDDTCIATAECVMAFLRDGQQVRLMESSP